MAWEVEYTDEFGAWWDDLDEDVQVSVDAKVLLLQEFGPNLHRPHADKLKGSSIDLRELRVQHGGQPYRILYTFNPMRNALLILGGNKAGDDRWYETNVARAEKIFARILSESE